MTLFLGKKSIIILSEKNVTVTEGDDFSGGGEEIFFDKVVTLAALLLVSLTVLLWGNL